MWWSRLLCRVALSGAEDVRQAVEAAKRAQPAWADVPPVRRGMILHDIVLGMKAHQKELAEIVAADTGKSYKDAYGETGGAIALGHPLGCTGAKLTTQLIYEMQERQLQWGLVSMCIGFGMGAAGIFEIEE